jgi:branched-chain amino acid transport system permease protein
MLRARSEILTRVLATVSTALVLSVFVTLIVLVGTTLGDDAFDARIATALVFMVVVIGTYVFIGNSGVVSFGHISFMAIGGYMFALMTVPPIRKSFLLPNLPGWVKDLDVNFILAAIIAGGLAAVFALIIGWPLMRLSGIPASIALFAVLLVVNVFVSQAYDITRGQQTMVGIPSTLAATADKALPWVVVAIFAAGIFQSTRYGLRLRCSREDEFGAKAIGISIPRARMIALVFSAFIVGVGGAMYGALLGSLTPQGFYIEMTFTTIVMLVVGGMRSLTGAVIGTVVVVTVQEILRRLEDGFDFTAGQTRWEALLLWIATAAVGVAAFRIWSARDALSSAGLRIGVTPAAQLAVALLGLVLWVCYLALDADFMKWTALALLGISAAIAATLFSVSPRRIVIVYGILAALTVVFAVLTAAGVDAHVPERPGLQPLGVSVLALLILIFRPSGLTGGREVSLPSLANLRAVAAFARSGGGVARRPAGAAREE